MKKRNKYFVVIIVFLLIMSFILIFFMNRFDNVIIFNKTNSLLHDLYSIKSGDYYLNNGVLYSGNYIIGNKEYINGSGNIIIDKYNNVKFLINYNNKCISKTYLGNIEVNDGMCGSFKDINVKIIKNNNIISFVSDERLEYKISSNDDFYGDFISIDSDNLIINSYSEGVNYIWFKDSLGNISDTLSFSVDCLNTSKAIYDSSVFYCSLSTVMIDNIEWIVLKDNNSDILLMKYLPIDEKLSMFNSEDNIFKWSESYINYYLNNEFINKLSSDTRNKLIDFNICDDYESYDCNNEVCGGMNKEYINKNNYSCNKYSKSKIKVISYDEFNYAYSKGKNLDILNGNYWAINSFSNSNFSSVQFDNSFYILNKYNDKLDVKPVINLRKNN